jgi:hypothetical protein
MTKKRTILFDNGVPVRCANGFSRTVLSRLRNLAHERLKNGELLRIAETDFDVLITPDSNIEYQQSLPDRDIPLIVLRAFRISMKYYEHKYWGRWKQLSQDKPCTFMPILSWRRRINVKVVVDLKSILLAACIWQLTYRLA